MPGKYKDEIGNKYGRLVVTSNPGITNSSGHKLWHCLCTCGREVNVLGTNLRQGTTQSCGCLQKERVAAQSITHGMEGTPTYKSWASMKHRCSSASTGHNYQNYYRRGVRVCAGWNSFENFLNDMGECPAGTSIDRIDNDGNYEPSNCRWATRKQQSQNRRDNKLTEASIREIKALREREKFSQKQISTIFNVDQSLISRILSGEHWGNISEEKL